ncbi:MAG: hypothetical protein KAS02_02740 [Candidatus Pacebacteria bacterium]|nr:hypothetical protein [Candidatus Paceibacterota bacterium]
MKLSLKKGFSFGLTSGVITTLGLITGFSSSEHSKMIIISGIIIIAISDALSDSLGMHVSEESDHKNGSKDIWEATFATFCSKFIFSLSFLIPILLFELPIAVIISVVWGLFLIALFSYYLARSQGENPVYVILEHVLIALIVIMITHFVGFWFRS